MEPTLSEPARAPKRPRRGINAHPGQAKTTYVRKRLLETLEFIDKKHLIASKGITYRTINLVLTTESSTVPWAVATPLDRAWAKYVKGHDLDTLDVPHGTTSTYHTYGCRCQPCSEACTLRERHRIAGRPTAGSPLNDARKRALVALHLDRLHQHATLRHIAVVAGIDRTTVRNIAADPTYGITLKTAVALLGVKVADVVGNPTGRLLVDSRPTRHRIGTLRALGYPIAWQEKQIGTSNNLSMAHRRNKITASTANRLADLARRVGDRQPGPETGIDPIIAERTRRAARKAGWYPPMAYDDDGRLDITAIPNDTWAKADDWTRRRVTVLHLLATGHTAGQAADATGVTRSAISKRVAHGLTYALGECGYDELDTTASATRIAQILDVHERLDAGEYGFVYAALKLDIQPRNYRSLSAWKDHPELLAWDADQENARIDVPTSKAA